MTPEVRVLDARTAGLDEAGLRAWARSRTDATRAGHVSRSYRYPYAAVAWHSGPVGIDIERIEPCDEAFLDSICTPSERRARHADGDPETIALWCGKEALAKALGDALAYDPRRLESPSGWPGGRSGAWHAERVPVPAGHVAWLCWR